MTDDNYEDREDDLVTMVKSTPLATKSLSADSNHDDLIFSAPFCTTGDTFVPTVCLNLLQIIHWSQLTMHFATHSLYWGSKVSLLWQPSLIQSNSHRFSWIGYLVELNHNNQPVFFEPEIELSRFWTKFNHRLNRQILSLFLLVAQPDDFCFSFGFLNWLFRNPDPSNAMF